MKHQNSKTPNKLKSKLGQPKKYLTGKGEHINKGKSANLGKHISRGIVVEGHVKRANLSKAENVL